MHRSKVGWENLNALELGSEMFHVHGSECRSIVDVDPKLRDRLFRVHTLWEREFLRGSLS